MSGVAVPDVDQRLKSITTFDRPVLLEAGAGTGKTAVLVERIAAWCLTKGWRRAEEACKDHHPPAGPEEIAHTAMAGVVAITFTEKAAGELAGRLEDVFVRLASGASLNLLTPELAGLDEATCRHRAAALRAAVDHCHSGTIHAFCQKLVRRHALTLGLHPGMTLDEQGWSLRGLVEDVLLEAISGPDSPLREALAEAHRYGADPKHLLSLLELLSGLGVKAAGIGEDFFSSGRLTALREEISRTCQYFANLLPVKGSRIESALAIRASALVLARSIKSAPVEDWAELAGPLAGNADKKLSDWAKGEFTKSERAALETPEANISAIAPQLRGLLATLAGLDPETFRAMQHAASILFQEVQRRKTRAGLISFQDLLDQALVLLSRHPGILTQEREAIRHLLVDEFQDTDWTQSEIVRLLALAGPQDKRPDLFAVGDPKQSIYAWRSADLEAYAAFKNHLLENEGADHRGLILHLQTNFRSVPAVIDQVDRLVAPLMVEEEGLQPAFQTLLPFRRPGQGVPAVECWISPPTGKNEEHDADTARKVEAQAIAADLIRQKEQGGLGQWQDAALLLRTTTAQSIYLDVLRDAGIPVQAPVEKEFYRNRIVLDQSALLCVLLDPLDELSLLTLLRSSFIGVPDAALLPLWQGGLPSVLRRTEGVAEALTSLLTAATGAIPPHLRGPRLVDGWQHNLRHFAVCLPELRDSLANSSWMTFQRKLQTLLFTQVTDAARAGGAHFLALHGKFYQRAGRLLSSGQDGWRRLLEELRSGMELDRLEISIESPTPDAVWLMTIHKAKGLEFPHVYLPDLSHETRNNRPDLLILASPGHGAPMEASITGITSPGFFRLRRHQDRVRDAEDIRLLYVAMTRARERLVMCGQFSAESKKKNSLAAKLSPHLPLPEFHDSTGEILDSHGVSWRRLGGTPEGMALRRPPPDFLPAPGEAVLMEQHLQTRRRQAAIHQAAPWRAAPSHLAHEAYVQHTQDAEEAAGFPTGTDPRATGVLVHKVLEELDLGREPGEALQEQIGCLPTYAAHLLPPLHMAEAAEAAAQLLNTPASAMLIRELVSLEPHLLGREVPMLLHPGHFPETGATTLINGAIDLLYRDPESGAVIAADFKTGVPSKEQSAAYARQGAPYLKAVQVAMNLTKPPLFELWWLRTGERERLPQAPDSGP